MITTHKRPDSCSELLEQVARELPTRLQDDLHVLVMNDRSSTDYGEVERIGRAHFGPRFELLTSKRWLAKAGYWLSYQAAFEWLKVIVPRHTLFLQDDISLAPAFFDKAFARWEAIDDPRKTVLSLISMAEDETDGRWVRHARRELPSAKVWCTQWFDLSAYLVDQRFFDQLDYKVFAPDPKRFRRRAVSSGVGEQFTRRLWRRGNIYQVVETLAFHGAQPSMMNPDARVDRPMDNRGAAK